MREGRRDPCRAGVAGTVAQSPPGFVNCASRPVGHQVGAARHRRRRAPIVDIDVWLDDVHMATTTAAPPRFRTVTGAGTIVALILVLAFGNAAYRDWVNNHTGTNDAGGFFLRQLTWPAWSFDSNQPLRDLLATDLKALLLVVFTAVFLALLAVAPGWGFRGVLGAIIAGWGGFIFAVALAGLLAAFLTAHASLLTAFTWAAAGAVYGLFVGWIVGLTTLAFRR